MRKVFVAKNHVIQMLTGRRETTCYTRKPTDYEDASHRMRIYGELRGRTLNEIGQWDELTGTI